MIMDTYNFALFDAIGIPVEIKKMKNDSLFYSPNSFVTFNFEYCYNLSNPFI
jgi:hypothetical protein